MNSKRHLTASAVGLCLDICVLASAIAMIVSAAYQAWALSLACVITVVLASVSSARVHRAANQATVETLQHQSVPETAEEAGVSTHRIHTVQVAEISDGFLISWDEITAHGVAPNHAHSSQVTFVEGLNASQTPYVSHNGRITATEQLRRENPQRKYTIHLHSIEEVITPSLI